MANEVEKKVEEVAIVPDANEATVELAKTLKGLQDELATLKAEKNVVDPAKEKNINIGNEKEGDSLNLKMRSFVNEAKQKGINIEGDASSGATLSVPKEFSKELAKLLNESGVMRQNAKMIKMTSKSMTLNVLDGMAEATFRGQTLKSDGTNDTFRDVTFVRKSLSFVKTVANELIQDASFDLAQELLDISREAFTTAEDKAGFVGTSPIEGVTVASGVNEIELTGTLNQAGALTYGKLVDMVYATTGAKTGQEKLYMHKSVWSKVRQLEDSNGNLIGAGQSLLNANFEGIPVVFVEAMPTASNGDSTGVCLAVYGDMRNVYFAVRDEFRVQPSDTATVTLTDGTVVNCYQQRCHAFLFEEDIDIQVVHPAGFSKLVTAH